MASKKPSDVLQDKFCWVCLSQYTSEKHLESNTHGAKLEIIEKLNSNPDLDREKACRICFIICSGQNQLSFHLKSDKHKEFLRKFIKKTLEDSSLFANFPSILSSSLPTDLNILNNYLKGFSNILRNLNNKNEENSLNLLFFIEKELENYKSLFQSCIKYLRENKMYTLYSSEMVDNNFDNLMATNDLTNRFVAKSTIGDGNCFYRAISYVIFRSEDYFFYIKICCVFLLHEYKVHFKSFLRDSTDQKSVSDDTIFLGKILYFLEDNTYSDECSYLLASILINIPLISITCCKRSVPFKLKYCTSKNIDKQPIHIGFLSQHMVSMLPKTGQTEIESSEINNVININKFLGSDFELNLYEN